MNALIHIGVSEELELKFFCGFLKASNMRKVKAATNMFFPDLLFIESEGYNIIRSNRD